MNEIRRDLGQYTYFWEGDLYLGSIPWMKGLEDGEIRTSETQTEELFSLYEAEIAYNDHYFGELVESLKASGSVR